MRFEKRIIGWREYLAIPALHIEKIKAKIDTGARTSALHVTDLEIKKRKTGDFAYFKVHPVQRKSLPSYEAKAKVVEYREIKSSNGSTSERPVIEVDIFLGGQKQKIELTLVNRDLMGFRMLLGREAVRKGFLVNPGKSYMISKSLKEKK